jgi:O-antigen/teichoic acid export membrane protein
MLRVGARLMRRKRITANFGAALSGKVVIAIQQLLLVPIFLNKWGADYYGAWLVLTAIPSMLSLSNLGFGTASSTKIVLMLGRKDDETANSFLLASVITLCAIYTILGIVILLLPAGILSIIANTNIDNPRVILLGMLGSLALVEIARPLEGYWTSRNRAAQSILYRTYLSLGQFSSTIAIVFLGGLAKHVSVGMFVVTTIWLILYTISSAKHVCLHASFRIKGEHFIELLKKGLGFQSSAIWQVLYFQGSVILANFLFGQTGAANWGTLRTLSRFGNQLIEVVSQSVYPELQTAISKNNWNEVRILHSNSITVACIAAVTCGFILIVGAPWFYMEWTQNEFQVGRGIWSVMALGILLNSLWWTSGSVQKAANRPWYMNSLGIFSAIFSLAAMWLLGQSHLGIFGIVCGSIVFEFVMAVYILKRSLLLIDDTLSDFIRRGISALKTSFALI